MNKKLIFLSILVTIGLLFTISGTNAHPKLLTNAHRRNAVREVSFSLQATEVPPIEIPTIVVPTIVINPAPQSGGPWQFGSFTMLLLVLVAALIGGIILIALIAVARRT